MTNAKQDGTQFDAFVTTLMSEPRPEISYPVSHYDEEGNCLEILFSGDNYQARRIDNLVTIYVHPESGEIIGASLKSIRTFIDRLTNEIPGAKIDLSGAGVRLEYLLTAAMWRSKDRDKIEIYIELRDRVDNLVVTFCPA